jgi:glycosylphosphatidylinositol transamidase (GPIT) subunit GPI8
MMMGGLESYNDSKIHSTIGKRKNKLDREDAGKNGNQY